MNPFDRSLRQYLSRALFVNSITSPSIGTDPMINNQSLYDFITLVLQLKGCCGGTTEEVLDDLLIPLNAFTITDKKSNLSIDAYAAVNTALQDLCGCTVTGNTMNSEELKTIYIDRRSTY
jgi:hypothetical protein